MEQKLDGTEILSIIASPVFCVKNDTIIKLNEAAARLFLRAGISIQPLLETGKEEYADFSGEILYLTLLISNQKWGAAVTRIGDTDIFVLDQQFKSEELRVLALAARELRRPLANIMNAAQDISDADVSSRLNRGLHQMLRIIGNMSDASDFSTEANYAPRDLDGLFREVTAKAASLTEAAGIQIRYSGPDAPIVGSVDCQMLERAALNMLSNAIKFSEPGGCIHVSLHCVKNRIRFSVTDNGCGIPENLHGSIFQRYLRSPAIEDSRFGIGLGMLLIRNAAENHQGAVLIDHPDGTGTRISLIFSARNGQTNTLHSPKLRTDYAGEHDHVLVELSDSLPWKFY